MTKTLLTIGLLFVFITLKAQKNAEGKILWSKDGLNWSHFQGRPDLTLPYASLLSYRIGYQSDKATINDTTYRYIKTFCYIVPSDSWIRADSKNSALLIYNQTLFDIAELTARKMQVELNKGYAFFEIQTRFNQLFTEANKRFELFKEETSDGKNPGEVYRWSNLVKEELENTPSVYIPDFKLKYGKWRYGLFVGADVGTFNGGVSDYFRSGGGLVFGFDFSCKKSQFTFDGSFVAGNKLKQDFNDKGIIRAKGMKLSTIFVQFTYGYALKDDRHWRIAPYVGLGIAEVTDADREKKTDSFYRVSYKPVGGLSIDYKIKNSVNLMNAQSVFFKNKGELTELAVKSRVAAMPIGYDITKGWGLVASVSFCVSGILIY